MEMSWLKRLLIVALLGVMTFTLAMGCGDGKRRQKQHFNRMYKAANKNKKPGDGKDLKGGDTKGEDGGDLGGSDTKDKSAKLTEIKNYENGLTSGGVLLTEVADGEYKLTGIYTSLSTADGDNYATSSATVSEDGSVSADASKTQVVGSFEDLADAGRDIGAPLKLKLEGGNLSSLDSINHFVASKVTTSAENGETNTNLAITELEGQASPSLIEMSGAASGTGSDPVYQSSANSDVRMRIHKEGDGFVAAFTVDNEGKDKGGRRIFLTYSLSKAASATTTGADGADDK